MLPCRLFLIQVFPYRDFLGVPQDLPVARFPICQTNARLCSKTHIFIGLPKIIMRRLPSRRMRCRKPILKMIGYTAHGGIFDRIDPYLISLRYFRFQIDPLCDIFGAKCFKSRHLIGVFRHLNLVYIGNINGARSPMLLILILVTGQRIYFLRVLIHLQGIGQIHHLLIKVNHTIPELIRFLNDYSINLILGHCRVSILQLFHHHPEGDALSRINKFTALFYLEAI
jgi:hypothetical protein